MSPLRVNLAVRHFMPFAPLLRLRRAARRVPPLLALIAVLAWPLNAQAQVDPEDAVGRAQIPDDLRSTYRAYKAALGTSAEDAIQYYAPDAVVMVNSDLIFRGRNAIRTGFLEHFLQAQSSSQSAQGTPVTPLAQVVVADSAVTLLGRHGIETDAGRQYGGLYGNTWQRQPDGRWKLVASIITAERAPAED